MRVSVVAVEDLGLTLRRRRDIWTVPFGELLTVERMPSGLGLRLHVSATSEMWIWTRGRSRRVLEDRIRQRGVRIVDCWGAIVSPTLADFEAELANEPTPVRQSSDNG